MLISTASHPGLVGQYLNSQIAPQDAKPAAASPVSEQPPPAPADSAPAEAVQLSTAYLSEGAARPGVYAEIWKDGVKVALVDQTGGVTPLSSMVPGSLGSGGGVEVAARRAVQIAVAVGGEIRSMGAVVSPQTLNMRAKLQTTYGAL